ncbi:lipopolysaccharide biosynthesis protein [Taylorella asinigenitalis]|uniref:O-antigen flippase Wzx n=1 Tax=Taylorella asinigenitalis (strain MCE3) TaxID=1008459 RepID=G4QCN6_TAYAM|nr:oligosaccharide flippase family protein [Taylorella asinigenitalis]AEP36166.1 O-antigen flippase Wzx [Taylorella asinigenitalis MCE3]
MSLKKNISILFFGNVISQLLPLFATPVVARLYTPSDFGQFSVIFTLILIGTSVASNKFEQAIPLPKNNKKAYLLFRLSIVVLLLSCFTLISVGYALLLISPNLISSELYSIKTLTFILIGILFLSLNQIYAFWLNRHEKFWVLSTNKILTNTVNVISMVGFGFLNTGKIGLIFSDCLSRFSSYIHSYIFCKSRMDSGNNWFLLLPTTIKVKLLVKTFREYKLYPLYVVPANFINVIANNLYIFAFAIIYESYNLGLVTMATKLILVPMDVLVTSVNKSLMQPMANKYREFGECRSIFINTFKFLILIPLPFILIEILFLDELTLLVLGEEWAELSTVIYIMTPMFYSYFVSGVLSVTLISLGKQKLNFLLQFFLFFLLVIVFCLSYVFNLKFFDALILYSLTVTIYNVLSLYSFYKIASGFKFFSN